MLTNKPFAFSIVTRSKRGFVIAASAASIALLSPDASPVPNTALPISDIIVLMSAKSRLTRPG